MHAILVLHSTPVGGKPMARMHARKKGKSGSTRPLRYKKPAWQTIDDSKVEEIIVDLGKSGMSTSMIGIVLRDQYGVPSTKLTLNKKITAVLESNGIKRDIPEDLMNLMKKAVRMHRHMENNHKDLHNNRGLHLVEARIRRLVKYYKKTEKLPEDWKYNYNTAKLLVQ